MDNFLKKGTNWAIFIGIIGFVSLTGIYWNGFSVSIPLILGSREYFTILVGLFGFVFGIYKFFYVLELKKEHHSHLIYIQKILVQNKINVDTCIFETFNEAKDEFRKYKKGYIVPYGYKFSILGDNITFNEDEERINETFFEDIESIDQFKRKVLDNDNGIYREFIDIKDFVDRVRGTEEMSIDISKNGYNDIAGEFFLITNSIDDLKTILLKNKSIVIIEGYLFVNILKNV